MYEKDFFSTIISNMITVISGTNRKNSKTRIVANTYFELFKKATNAPVHFIALDEVPLDFITEHMYKAEGQSKSLADLQNEKLVPANKFFIVSPEYNGGMAGILKLFLDAVSIREYAATFKGKKAGLAGVSSGRAGNLRGLDQLTGVLNHVGTMVMPSSLPISGIEKLTDGTTVTDPGTLQSMTKQVQAFVAF
jgi:chromate reductase, NAD(P)H dehydrogenase (quinone)